MEKSEPIPAATTRHARLRSWAALVAIALLLPGSVQAAGAADTARPLTFERDIRPIFKARCFQCHGEGEKLKGGVDLRLRRLMLSKVESGSVLSPGHPEDSVLWKMVSSGDMPKGEKKLTREQLATVEQWIRDGAPTARPEPAEVPKFFITEEERSFWSFRPVRRPVPPVVRHPEAVRTPVDAFILRQLEDRGLGFAPEADRPTLIRRLSLDLTGLPPTPEEVRTFLADDSPDAYERLVERVLASPRYGERWARHWLDVAGYADSNGGTETDSERAWIWRYRDYVIRSFNADKPFSEFVTEQLAGDELVSPPYEKLDQAGLDRLIATGFLRLAPDPTGDGPADPDLARNQVIADTLQIVSSSLLGMTVQCAQCHDHRYDPIPQSDYYRLRAIFEPAFDWKHWKSPGERLVSLAPKEQRDRAEAIEAEARKIDAEASKLHDELIEQFVQRQLELVPKDLRQPVLQARRTPKEKRSKEQLELLRQYPTFQDGIILGEIDKEGQKQVDAVNKRAAELRSKKSPEAMVHALVEDPGRKVDTFLFHRGDHQQPREKLTPGTLTVLASSGATDLPESDPALRTTGRRLALAKSLTDGTHPLTGRVLVNRIWHHLLGAGLVTTLGDFGFLGERPSHPELLDWLADELVARRWKLKSLHRVIVQSAVYRQSSVHAAAQRVDPENKWLGRARLKRLDGESLRDSMLAVSGNLCTEPFGPPVPVAYSLQGQVVVGNQDRNNIGIPIAVTATGTDDFRRSIFVKSLRTMPLGVLETFDAPALTPNCEARPVSTVAPQSLMMMNDHFVLRRAHDLARRVRSECPGDTRAQARRVWNLVFTADPSPAELERSLVYIWRQAASLCETALAAQKPRETTTKDSAAAAQPDWELDALASWCQALMGANRFLYID